MTNAGTVESSTRLEFIQAGAATVGAVYDLQSDPGERNNVYNNPSYASVQAHLWKRMTELRREIGDMGASDLAEG